MTRPLFPVHIQGNKAVPACQQRRYRRDMNFKTATDRLTDCVSSERIAQELGVEPSTVRRYRMAERMKNARNPPAGWQAAIIRLCDERIEHFRKLKRALSRP